MSNRYHKNLQNIVADFADDSVGALADTIPLLARQFLRAGPTRFVCQGIEAFQDSRHVPLRNAAQIFGDGLSEEECLYLPIRLQVSEEFLVCHRGLVGSLIEGG